MAPDRGLSSIGPVSLSPDEEGYASAENVASTLSPNEEGSASAGNVDSASLLTDASPDPDTQGRSLTIRGIGAGLLIGLVICFSNMYFGLQTGWISTMTMPASLMGFGIFKMLSRHLQFPFSPVENVLVQTVAGSMAVMPLGCGFVGVVPAMQYLLKSEEHGPVNLSTWKLVVWALGLCYFGVVFAVPLRRQVIVREKLKFPSGFSTAVLITVLHGKTGLLRHDSPPKRGHGHDVSGSLSGRFESDRIAGVASEQHDAERQRQQWRANVKLLLTCFLASGLYTFATFFFPILRNLHIFGHTAASAWLWTFNPSLAYVGQGIIMGPATTIHMLLGAVIGWGILSPLAKYRGWAPGKVSNWENGSKGWVVWPSLAIMLADAVVSLGYLATRPLLQRIAAISTSLHQKWNRGETGPSRLLNSGHSGYISLQNQEGDDTTSLPPSNPPNGGSHRCDFLAESDEQQDSSISRRLAAQNQDDAPPSQLVSTRTVIVGLILSIAFCVLCIQVVFDSLVPLYATITAVFMALVLSIMGVRALGETDLNPVSGISKLAQLFFALIIPQAHPTKVLINLVAGAVSEAGALQAGDLMQDLKTGHLLGAAPRAQFWGQVVGATAGAVVSAFIYRLYTAVYTIPGSLFQVPTAYVWIFTARLVTGQGLPYMAREWAVGFAVLFTATTMVRIHAAEKRWQQLIPGGIAVAVGMYNVPSFTLARTVGGLVAWWWRSKASREDTPLIVSASGFILGEGFLSIINLMMEGFGVPHL